MFPLPENAEAFSTLPQGEGDSINEMFALHPDKFVVGIPFFVRRINAFSARFLAAEPDHNLTRPMDGNAQNV